MPAGQGDAGWAAEDRAADCRLVLTARAHTRLPLITTPACPRSTLPCPPAQAELEEMRAAHTALEAEAAALQQAADAAASSSRWREERDAKREADWDARLKEAYK